MNKNYLTFTYATSGISIIIGLILIFNSYSRGQSLAFGLARQNGGTFDPIEYNRIFDAGINQYLLLGGIFAGGGMLIAILVSFVLLLRSKPLPEEEAHV